MSPGNSSWRQRLFSRPDPTRPHKSFIPCNYNRHNVCLKYKENEIFLTSMFLHDYDSALARTRAKIDKSELAAVGDLDNASSF